MRHMLLTYVDTGCNARVIAPIHTKAPCAFRIPAVIDSRSENEDTALGIQIISEPSYSHPRFTKSFGALGPRVKQHVSNSFLNSGGCLLFFVVE